MKEEKTVHFVSTFEMYEKEKSGIKANTVRAMFSMRQRPEDATYVCIHKGYTKEKFTRRITDVTLFGGNVIISWNPNEVN